MAKNIHEAILEVMKKVGYVQKQRGKNLQYTYAGEAALIAALRPAMIESGVFSHVVSIAHERDTYQTKSGTTMNLITAVGVVRFVHAASESFIDVQAIGEGADVGDKAASKASTGFLKYALRQTFLIETGDDPDKSPSGDMERSESSGWTPEQIKAIVDAGYSQNDFSVKNTLAKSELYPEIPTKWVLLWFKFYRAARDTDKTSDEAALIATGKYKTEVEKAKKVGK